MPTFEFVCEACGHRFEKLVPSNKRPVPCAKCRSKKTTRQFGVFALNFGAAPGETKKGSICGCGADGCAPCSAGL